MYTEQSEGKLAKTHLERELNENASEKGATALEKHRIDWSLCVRHFFIPPVCEKTKRTAQYVLSSTASMITQ